MTSVGGYMVVVLLSLVGFLFAVLTVALMLCLLTRPPRDQEECDDPECDESD